jgi:uncharacterized HAD superfamily protein
MSDVSLNLGIDVDGVIRDHVTGLREVYLKDFPGHVVLPVTAWDVSLFYPIGKDIYDYWFRRRPLEAFGFAPVYDGARVALQKLWRLGHRIHIITSQVKRIEDITVKWLHQNDIPYDSIHFTDAKHLVKCDLYVDDAPHNLMALYEAGLNVVCFDRPWNQEVDWCHRVRTYDELVEIVQHEVEKRTQVR